MSEQPQFSSPEWQRAVQEVMGRVGQVINDTLAQAPHLALLARPLRRPVLPRRYGKITPERAPSLLPAGLRVRHRYFDRAGTVGPHGDGLYRADVSGWLVSVRITWDDGQISSASPRDLTPEAALADEELSSR